MSTHREQQREETRKRLYEASLRIFRRDGVAGARIDEIAQEAGVSRGTFYFHYPSKEDVLLQLLRESQEEMVVGLEALDPQSALPVVLERVAVLMARTWEDDAGLLAQLGMVALKRTAANLAELEESHPAAAALVPWFEKAAERGEVGDLIPPALLTEFFLVNIFGAALAWCGNPVVGLEELLRNVVIFFLRAARPEMPDPGSK